MPELSEILNPEGVEPLSRILREDWPRTLEELEEWKETRRGD
jgi:hypothetical protein